MLRGMLYGVQQGLAQLAAGLLDARTVTHRGLEGLSVKVRLTVSLLVAIRTVFSAGSPRISTPSAHVDRRSSS